MFEIISRNIETVTPEIAKEWLKHNTFMSQRKLRPAHVTRLTNAMKSGIFTTGNIAFAQNPSGSRVELMNGQHQLSAVVKSGCNIVANIERTVCEKLEDAANYFSQFDVGITRSVADIVTAEANAIGVTWSKHICKLLVAAMPHIGADNMYRTLNSNISKYERACALSLHSREGQFLSDVLTGENGRMLQKVPVVVAAIMTMRVNTFDARTFWHGVRTGIDLTAKDPRRPLRDYLMMTSMAKEGRATYQGAVSARAVSSRCVSTWNLWRDGVPRTFLVKYSPENPFPIAK